MNITKKDIGKMMPALLKVASNINGYITEEDIRNLNYRDIEVEYFENGGAIRAGRTTYRVPNEYIAVKLAKDTVNYKNRNDSTEFLVLFSKSEGFIGIIKEDVKIIKTSKYTDYNNVTYDIDEPSSEIYENIDKTAILLPDNTNLMFEHDHSLRYVLNNKSKYMEGLQNTSSLNSKELNESLRKMQNNVKIYALNSDSKKLH